VDIDENRSQSLDFALLADYAEYLTISLCTGWGWSQGGHKRLQWGIESRGRVDV